MKPTKFGNFFIVYVIAITLIAICLFGCKKSVDVPTEQQPAYSLRLRCSGYTTVTRVTPMGQRTDVVCTGTYTDTVWAQ